METRVFVLLALALAVSSLSLSSSHSQGDPIRVQQTIVGGVSAPIFVDNEDTLPEEFKEYNAFIRNNIQKVSGKKLIWYTKQVVSGMKYCFNYGNKTSAGVTDAVEVCIWSQPWKKGFLEITAPSGRKITVNK